MGRAAQASPTRGQLALVAFDRVWIAEDAVAQWPASIVAVHATLEAGGHVEGQVPEGDRATGTARLTFNRERPMRAGH